MEYETALKLKKSGFPQEGNEWVCSHSYYYDGKPEATLCTDERVYSPSLSDLLTALGDRELKIVKKESVIDNVGYEWRVSIPYQDPFGFGPTLEIALSDLYLSLHSK